MKKIYGRKNPVYIVNNSLSSFHERVILEAILGEKHEYFWFDENNDLHKVVYFNDDTNEFTTVDGIVVSYKQAEKTHSFVERQFVSNSERYKILQKAMKRANNKIKNNA